MSGAVPRTVIGLAVFINILGLVQVSLGFLLSFMLWRHGERFSYILMLSAFTTLGAIIVVIQHLDYTLNWREIQILRYENSKAPGYNRTGVFGKADSGWRSVLHSIAIYSYNVDSLLVLFWAITLFIGTWSIRIKSERKRTMSMALKVMSVVLPAVITGICSIEAVKTTPMVYLIVINAIMTVSFVSGGFLVLAILYKYLISCNVLKRFTHSNAAATAASSRGTVSSATTVARRNTRTTIDKWLIIRFSIIMAVLAVFEVALIVYELVNYQRNRQAIQQARTQLNTGPDFSTEQAKVDIYQYMSTSVPCIVTFCIFGTTAPFRRAYISAAKAFFCCRKQRSYENSSLWIKLQSQPHRAQTHPSHPKDNGISRSEGSLPVCAKSGIAVEVKTEIFSSPISNVPRAANRPWEIAHQISFGGTSIRPQDSPFQPDMNRKNSNKWHWVKRSLSPQRPRSKTPLASSSNNLLVASSNDISCHLSPMGPKLECAVTTESAESSGGSRDDVLPAVPSPVMGITFSIPRQAKPVAQPAPARMQSGEVTSFHRPYQPFSPCASVPATAPISDVSTVHENSDGNSHQYPIISSGTPTRLEK